MDNKTMNVLEKIQESKSLLPKKQRVLCDFILDNQLLIGTMTVAELAERADVSATTVLRLIEKLGYGNYVNFKRALFESALRVQNETYAPLVNSFSREPSDDTLTLLCEDVMKNCYKITEGNVQKAFREAVQLLLCANRIYVLGLRSAAAISMYFENSIRLFMDNTFLLSLQQEYLFDRVLEITQRDVLFLVSTWPCTKKTVDFARLCSERNVPIVLVTNSSLNPIIQYSAFTINTESVNKSSDHVSSLIVCQAFIEELGRRAYPQSSQKLSELDAFFKQNDVVIWDTE